MSGPVSDELRESADDLREVADGLESLAEEILNDDSVLNDLSTGDLMDQATDLQFQAGVMDALADAADWLGF